MVILIIEDEPKIRDVLKAYFEKEGWQADVTGNGHTALQMVRNKKYDLIILDLMIHGLSGEQVCARIRENSSVPIIMVTSKVKEEDAIRGLNLGADDYITKPFGVKEVVARIHALNRRIQDSFDSTDLEQTLKFNDGRLVIHPHSQEVYVNNKLVKLTATEIKLLMIMVSYPNKVFSRSDLSYQVQGYKYVGDGRTVDAHIKNLRKKIEKDTRNPEYIQTLVGSGYKFLFQPDEQT